MTARDQLQAEERALLSRIVDEYDAVHAFVQQQGAERVVPTIRTRLATLLDEAARLSIEDGLGLVYGALGSRDRFVVDAGSAALLRGEGNVERRAQIGLDHAIRHLLPDRAAPVPPDFAIRNCLAAVAQAASPELSREILERIDGQRDVRERYDAAVAVQQEPFSSNPVMGWVKRMLWRRSGSAKQLISDPPVPGENLRALAQPLLATPDEAEVARRLRDALEADDPSLWEPTDIVDALSRAERPPRDLLEAVLARTDGMIGARAKAAFALRCLASAADVAEMWEAGGSIDRCLADGDIEVAEELARQLGDAGLDEHWELHLGRSFLGSPSDDVKVLGALRLVELEDLDSANAVGALIENVARSGRLDLPVATLAAGWKDRLQPSAETLGWITAFANGRSTSADPGWLSALDVLLALDPDTAEALATERVLDGTGPAEALIELLGSHGAVHALERIAEIAGADDTTVGIARGARARADEIRPASDIGAVHVAARFEAWLNSAADEPMPSELGAIPEDDRRRLADHAAAVLADSDAPSGSQEITTLRARSLETLRMFGRPEHLGSLSVGAGSLGTVDACAARLSVKRAILDRTADDGPDLGEPDDGVGAAPPGPLAPLDGSDAVDAPADRVVAEGLARLVVDDSGPSSLEEGAEGGRPPRRLQVDEDFAAYSVDQGAVDPGGIEPITSAEVEVRGADEGLGLDRSLLD